MCVLPSTGNPTFRFVPNGEDDPPDPAVLAHRAMDVLRLTTPAIHIAPAPPAMTYVGLDTWLWLPDSQWSSLRKSVSAGATTVTVTATPVRVRWDMGAGTTTCRDNGRPWRAHGMSDQATTTCKYRYQQVSDFEPQNRFTVTAAIIFNVQWACTGDCLVDDGSLGEVTGPTAGTNIRVGERQSVNVSPGGL